LGPDVTLRAAIQAALPFVERSFRDQPLIEARLRETVGKSFEYLGDSNAAVAELEPARALYTRLLGPDHPDTLGCVTQLAINYLMQGRYPEAAKLHEEVLAIWRAKVGPDAPETLKNLNNLVRAYYELRRYDEAIRMHQEVLAQQKAKLGPGHRSTLRTMVNLANDYSRSGRHDDALKLRQETLALQRAHLGPTDFDTLMTAHNLGTNCRSLGRYAEALRLDEETLALRKDTLGLGHPDTLTSLWSVAEDLIKLHRGQEAVPFLDECLERAVGQRVHRNFPTVADLRLRHFQEARDAAECRKSAELWEKQGRTDAASLYQAAVCRAVTAAVLRATDQSPAAARQADAEADRALEWLWKASAAGYRDVAKLQQDKEWDLLRDRPDFRKLLAESQAGREKEKS
jgi:tetratricopeptide (TPR) repeat protein